jgi:hypothetical protein
MGGTETLLLISISTYRGELSQLTIWATTSDLRAGHRRTDLETPAREGELMRRLAELVPKISGCARLAAAARPRPPPLGHAALDRPRLFFRDAASSGEGWVLRLTLVFTLPLPTEVTPLFTLKLPLPPTHTGATLRCVSRSRHHCWGFPSRSKHIGLLEARWMRLRIARRLRSEARCFPSA